MNFRKLTAVLSLLACVMTTGVGDSLAASGEYLGKMGVLVHPKSPEEVREVLRISDRVLDDRIGEGPLRVVLDEDGLAAIRVAGIENRVLVMELEAEFEQGVPQVIVAKPS